MRNIKNCTLSTEYYGIYSNIPIRNYIVYNQDINGLIGFRSTQDRSRIGNTYYIETGFFLNMLYEGYAEAYSILFIPKEAVEEDLLPSELKDIMLLNPNIINTLLTETADFLKKYDKKLADLNILLYICSMNLQLAENMIKNMVYEHTNIAQLQACLDTRITPDTMYRLLKRKLLLLQDLFENTSSRFSLPKYGDLNNILLTLRSF